MELKPTSVRDIESLEVEITCPGASFFLRYDRDCATGNVSRLRPSHFVRKLKINGADYLDEYETEWSSASFDAAMKGMVLK